jgi:hypothetical protein
MPSNCQIFSSTYFASWMVDQPNNFSWTDISMALSEKSPSITPTYNSTVASPEISKISQVSAAQSVPMVFLRLPQYKRRRKMQT